MRQQITVALTTALLAGLVTASVTAQDKDLRMGDDPAYFERVEVPEAGVAVSFPQGWEVDVQLEYDETESGDPETGYWNVLFAFGGAEGWCGLTRHPHPVGEVSELAPIAAGDLLESRGGEATTQATAVELTAGEAWRVDLQVPEGPDFYSTYLLDAPAGHLGEPSRFTLSCQSDERHYRDWMDVAETLEWLEASEPDEPGEPDLAGDDGPGYFFSVPTYELEPVEVLEAGVALSWPVGWPLEVPMTEGEHRLPTEYEDAGPVKAWILLRGEDELGDWCRLTRFEDHPMSLDEHASWERESLIASGFEDEAVMHTIWMVGGELAERIVVTTPGVSEVMHSYLFESAGVRYDLSCYSAYDDNLAWQEIAGSVQPLGAPADPGDELEVVEVPGAGVEVTLPLSWTFELTVEELGTFLPPPYGDVGEVSMLRALEATGPDGAWCNVYAYEQMPMSLDEHADWFASMVSANTDYPATVETSMISLPIGESVRLVEDYSAGEVHVLYLFDLDGARRYLACGATVLPDDAWLSVAQTVAPLESVSPIVPDDAVAWNLSEGFATVVPLSVSEDGGWMSAWCDHSLWLEYADGTFEERLDCRLTDDPVEPAEDQGVPPTETVIIDGGACEWISDYWLLQDDSEYWATAWSMSIEPDGQVLAVAVFGAEALDCD